MPSEQNTPEIAGRSGIIGAVTTVLGFFVLVVLVIEAAVGAIAATSTDSNQIQAFYGMLGLAAFLVLVVAFMAVFKPEVLLLPIGSPLKDLKPLDDFIKSVTGDWWEQIKPADDSRASFVEIHPDPVTRSVKIIGTAYREDGEVNASWESTAVCLDWSERKALYSWKGRHPEHADEPYEGFGEINFHGPLGRIDSGNGFFSDRNLTDRAYARTHYVEFTRCAPQDRQERQKGRAAVAKLIQDRFGCPGSR